MEHHRRVTEQSAPIMPGLTSALRYFGLPKHTSDKTKALNIAIHTTFVLSLLSCMIPQLIYVFSDKYDIIDKAEALAIILPMVRCMFKVLNRVFTMDHFWELYDDIQRVNDFNARDPAAKVILEARARSAHVLFKYFMSFYALLFVVFNVLPLALAAVLWVTGHPSGLTLQFKAEYFCDTSENPAFAIIYSVQALSAVATLYPAIWDSAFLSSCIHVLAQVEIVTDQFKKLSEIDENKTTINRDRLYNEEEENRGTEELKTCVKHHVTVIELVDKLEAVFSAQMAMDCFVAASLTCLSMFQVTYSTEITAKCKYFCLATFFYAAFYVQIFHGQKLLNESSRMERVVYAVRWCGHGPRYRRLVLLALQRAQRPLCITAMHFYVISSETSLTLLKASFSYFALMQTVVEK